MQFLGEAKRLRKAYGGLPSELESLALLMVKIQKTNIFEDMF
jgi:hypothetical protein